MAECAGAPLALSGRRAAARGALALGGLGKLAVQSLNGKQGVRAPATCMACSFRAASRPLPPSSAPLAVPAHFCAFMLPV